MSCIYHILQRRESELEEEQTWNKILGVRQPCSINIGCSKDGLCMNKEYYELFKVSGVVVACCKDGNGHLEYVTKEINGVEIVERRRQPHKSSRDWSTY